jgi:hypothetical protein
MCEGIVRHNLNRIAARKAIALSYWGENIEGCFMTPFETYIAVLGSLIDDDAVMGQ